MAKYTTAATLATRVRAEQAEQCTANKKLGRFFEPDPAAAEIIAAQAAEHLREIGRLDDLAYGFLTATQGDETKAANLLDDAVELLFAGGVLSTWRYRIVLSKIREGL